MRTNIVIEDELIKRAMEVSGARTKREAVEKGLKALIDHHAIENFRRLRGKIEWIGDLDDMRTSKWL